MITLRELRNKLVPGVEFVGTHMRSNVVARRKIVLQSPTQMVCQLLDGDKVGQLIYHHWKDTQAHQTGNDIYLMKTGEITPFLKINIVPK